jgi:hypothetical protein
MRWSCGDVETWSDEGIAREVQLFRVLSYLDELFPFLDPDHEDEAAVAKITRIDFDQEAEHKLPSLGRRGRKYAEQRRLRRQELAQQWEDERRKIVRKATTEVRAEAQRLKKEAFGYLVGLESLDSEDHVSEVKAMLKSLEEVRQRFEKKLDNMRDGKAANTSRNGKRTSDNPVEPSEVDGPNGFSDAGIDNVLVWRCILLTLFFCCATNNSMQHSSGVWHHLVPII